MTSCCLSNFEATLDKTNEMILLRKVTIRAHNNCDNIMGSQYVFNKSVQDKRELMNRKVKQCNNVTGCYPLLFVTASIYLGMLFL